MSIEELTKHQIILLCFLIAFVSSVATAITVVTLMEQAPVTGSPTINRIIQQIIPGETKEITKTNTVIIKEEDVIIEAINENKDAIITIHEVIPGSEGVESRDIMNGSGLVISKDGFVISNSKNISIPGQYYFMMGDTKVSLEFIKIMSEKYSLLKIKESELPLKLPFASLENKANPKVGSRVILISASPTFSALSGSISSIEYKTAEEVKYPVSFTIDITLSAKHLGGTLVNTDGDVIGFIVEGADGIMVAPSSQILKSFTDYKENKESNQTANVVGSVQKEGESSPQP
jgi:S1-C subfamily serine protease